MYFENGKKVVLEEGDYVTYDYRAKTMMFHRQILYGQGIFFLSNGDSKTFIELSESQFLNIVGIIAELQGFRYEIETVNSDAWRCRFVAR